MKKIIFNGLIMMLFYIVLMLYFVVPIHAATYTVTNTNDSGVGSLRQAINDANINAGVADSINFSVTGTITLSSSLPHIGDCQRISDMRKRATQCHRNNNSE